jgi:putative nucleotidyltransferase with HDIG domain
MSDEQTLRAEVQRLWPELEWIGDAELREKVTRVWVAALQESPLEAADLEKIPFTLLAENCTVSFMAHKRSVVHICKSAAETMRSFYGDALPLDMDTLLAGAILIDVGKLLEYERTADGGTRQSKTGRYLRHPFTGVALAHRFGLPDEVSHMIATHAKEGNLGRRSVESIIAHHADFLTFEPFMDHLE